MPAILLNCFACLAVLIVPVWAQDQAWSHQTYLYVRYTLTCDDMAANMAFTDENRGSWKKLGSDNELMADSRYELHNNSLYLTIRNVTNDMAGIYICDVLDKNGSFVHLSVYGVNIEDPLYHDPIDVYKTNIIRGVITMVCFVGVVVAISLVDNFRYKSDQQKEKERTRKMAMNSRDRLSQRVAAVDNAGMVYDQTNIEQATYGAIKQTDAYTHF